MTFMKILGFYLLPGVLKRTHILTPMDQDCSNMLSTYCNVEKISTKDIH